MGVQVLGEETKTCKECLRFKKLEQFYKHPGMADGRLNICKQCKREYQKKQHEKNRQDPHWVLKERVRALEKYYRLYATGRHWIVVDQPEEVKKAARVMLGNAVRSGKVKKPLLCEGCNEEHKLEGHHRNYFKPLEVVWLCRKCHANVHIISAEGVKHELL